MSDAIKKGIPLLLILFVGYYLFTDPRGLADASSSLFTTGWNALTSLFNAIINFSDSARG